MILGWILLVSFLLSVGMIITKITNVMGYYHTHRCYHNKGITFSLKDSLPVLVNFHLYIPKKKYNHDKHEPIIIKLLEEFKLRPHVYFDGVYVSFEAPFHGSEVIAIAYRRRLNRAIKSIVNYDYENVAFLTKYVKHYISKDYKKFYGG